MGKNRKNRNRPIKRRKNNDHSYERIRFLGSPDEFAQYLSLITFENIIRYHGGRLSRLQLEVYECYGLYLVSNLGVSMWNSKTLRGDRLHLVGYCPDDDSFEYAFRETDNSYSDMQDVRIKVFLSNECPKYGMMLTDTEPGVWKYYNSPDDVAYLSADAMNIQELRPVDVCEYEGVTVDVDMSMYNAMAELKKVKEKMNFK